MNWSTWHERGTKKNSESPTGIEPMTSGPNIGRVLYPLSYENSWVRFLSGTQILCPTLVSCWSIHLSHFITELKIHHCYSCIINICLNPFSMHSDCGECQDKIPAVGVTIRRVMWGWEFFSLYDFFCTSIALAIFFFGGGEVNFPAWIFFFFWRGGGREISGQLYWLLSLSMLK